LSVGTVKAVPGAVSAVVVVIIGIDFAGAYYGDIVASCPCNHSANMGKDPSVVPYTDTAAGQKEILLGVDVYQNPAALWFNPLPNHFSVVFPPPVAATYMCRLVTRSKTTIGPYGHQL